ncbi:MAG: AAA15 family ATPase/GTPase [Aureispira sp.]|jgi:AAA15 family ATPase/GTPase
MIINFSIKNFSSIKEEVLLTFEADNLKELDEYYLIEPIKGLKLLKLGLIFGPNASGKTTILKALDFIRNLVLNPLERKTEVFEFKPFLFDEKTVSENTFFSLEFIQNGVRYLHEIEFNKEAIVNEKLYFFNPNKALVYNRATDLDKKLSAIKFGSKITINKNHKGTLEANTLWNNSVLGGYIKTNFDSHELQEVISWYKEVLQPLITPKTDLYYSISKKIEEEIIDKKTVLEFLSKADFKISDIVIKKEKFLLTREFFNDIMANPLLSDNVVNNTKTGEPEMKKVYFQHTINNQGKNSNYTLSYEEESQGTQRYYQFSGLLELMLNNPIIFSIDELESSLHPDLLEHFLLSFLTNTKTAQIIATTHHRELLMKRDIFRNDVIWFTEKKADGGTDLYPLTDFDSSVVRNTSSIYNAYKIGKLGATPNLRDVYMNTTDEKK